MISMDSLTDKT